MIASQVNDLSAVSTVSYGDFNSLGRGFGRVPPLRSGPGCARRRARYDCAQRRRAPCAPGHRYSCCPAAPGSRPCGRASLTRRPSPSPSPRKLPRGEGRTAPDRRARASPHPPAPSPVRDREHPRLPAQYGRGGEPRHPCPSRGNATRPARAESIPRPGARIVPSLPRPPSTRRHSALGTRHSALGTRHSALGTRHSALGTRHSALGTRHSRTRHSRTRHSRTRHSRTRHSRTHALTHSRTFALSHFRTFALSHFPRQHTRPPNHPSNRPRLPSGASAP
jgi:hypothetical protein